MFFPDVLNDDVNLTAETNLSPNLYVFSVSVFAINYVVLILWQQYIYG